MRLKRILLVIISLVIIVAIVMISIYTCGSRMSTLSSSCIPSDGGSISPSEGTYDKGIEVDIKAIPASGYRFDHWEGSVSGTSPNISLTMDSNKDVVAYFAKLIPKSLSLINGVLTLPPGSYYAIPFSIDLDTMEDVRIEGMFQASGGSRNDIKAYIFDHTAFLNWVNGHPVTPIYSSGQVTIADLNVDITKPGDYHLVLENRFSILSSKNVFAQIDLHWSE